MMSVKSSLQETKDLLQEREVAYSLLQEQHAQASINLFDIHTYLCISQLRTYMHMQA